MSYSYIGEIENRFNSSSLFCILDKKIFNEKHKYSLDNCINQNPSNGIAFNFAYKKIKTYSKKDLLTWDNKFKFFGKQNNKGEFEELLISTTHMDVKDLPIQNIDDQLDELEKFGLIKLIRNKKNNKIETIKTNENADILNIRKLSHFSYKKIGFEEEASDIKEDDTFLLLAAQEGAENIIKKYIKNIYDPDTTAELNENSIERIIKITNFKNKIYTNKYIPGVSKLQNKSIEIKSGKLICDLEGENLEINVPCGIFPIYEIYDQSYKDNVETETILLKQYFKMNSIRERFTKIIFQEDKDYLEDTDFKKAESHGYNHDKMLEHYDFKPKSPNIHFIYIDLRMS